MNSRIKSYKNSGLIVNELKKVPNIWDLYTKKEEYQAQDLDEHDRFSFKNSTYKDVLKPTVSDYLKKQGFDIEYPNNKKFAIVLTHDVDDIYIKLRHLLFSFHYYSYNKDIYSILYLLKGLINKNIANYKNFNNILSIEKKYGATSTFYFLANPEDIFGTKYTLEEIASELEVILYNNCEIGFHTGYYSYANPIEIKTEKKKFEQLIGLEIKGVRNHVLRFKTPESWEILAGAGFKYDSSFGYHDMVGFRNGMCHPFYPFNINKNKIINIFEIPLVIQDWTLRMEMGKNVQNSWDYIKYLIDIAEKYHGVLTVLWHNWTFAYPVSLGGIFGKEWTLLYEKIMKYAIEKKGWLTNSYNLYKHFMKNGSLFDNLI